MKAVFTWLAPDAMQKENAVAALSAEERKKLLGQLDQASVGDLMQATAPEGGASASELKGAALTGRVRAIDGLLQGSGKDIATVLAGQLGNVANLSLETRLAILRFLRRDPPTDLGATARKYADSRVSSVYGSGLHLFGVAGDADSLRRELAGEAPSAEMDKEARQRDLALAVSLLDKPDLVEEGRRRVGAWNAQEKALLDAWTGGKPFSLARSEMPGLNADDLFQRVAWLAYLVRHEPTTYGAQFAREWLLTAEYQDYCSRSIDNLYPRMGEMSPADKKRAAVKDPSWRRLSVYLETLRAIAQPDMELLLVKNPEVAAAGLARAHFTLEFRATMNLLGAMDRGSEAGILERLTHAENRDLADFSAARLR